MIRKHLHPVFAPRKHQLGALPALAAMPARGAPAASTAHSVDGVLIPGVRVVSRKPAAAATAAAPAKKKKKGAAAVDSDDASMDGFGDEMQTLKNDIAHLRELFPGACARHPPPPPRPRRREPQAAAADAQGLHPPRERA